MARSGDIIEHPVRGERIHFLHTASETGGRLLNLEVDLRARSLGAGGRHIHPSQEERFRVLSGRVRLLQGEREFDLAFGEEAVVPPGTIHTFWNPFDVEARVAVEVRPALRLETLAETDFGLARDGKVGRNGEMKLLQAAVTMTEFAPEILVPQWYARWLLTLLAPIGRILGYKPYYDRYGLPPAVRSSDSEVMA